MSVGIDLKKTILRSKTNYLRWNLFLIPEKRSRSSWARVSALSTLSDVSTAVSVSAGAVSSDVSSADTTSADLSLQKLLLRILPL